MITKSFTGLAIIEDAEAARDAAQTAQGLAEHAQGDAQTAQGLAEHAQADAEAAQIAAAESVVSIQNQLTLATGQAILADEAADIALAAANYKGTWATRTGAAVVPYCVSHLGKFWMLASNLADVTTKTPGTATEWIDILYDDTCPERSCENGVEYIQYPLATGTIGSGIDILASGLTAERDYTLPDIDTMLAGAAIETENAQETIPYAVETHVDNAKVDYATPGLDTEAEIITAFNTTNGKINSILAILENAGIMKIA